jgi:hypothetical protein
MSKSKVYIVLQAKDNVTPVTRKMDKNTEQAFNKMKANAKASTASMGSSLQKLKSHWMAVTAAMAAVVMMAKKSVSAFMEQEKAEMKLAVAMKNQGDYTRENFRALKDYAAQLQRLTTYGDEVTIAMMANLKTYGMNTEQLKAATKATMNLASAKGIDLRAASELVGKAFVGETGTLSRYGIVLGKGIEQGEKFNAVLKLINERFGGSAQAEIHTYSGQLKQLSNWWGDITEKIGLGLLKAAEAGLAAFGTLNVGVVNTFKYMAIGLQKFYELLGKLPGRLGEPYRDATESIKVFVTELDAMAQVGTEFVMKNIEMLKSFDHVEKAIKNKANPAAEEHSTKIKALTVDYGELNKIIKEQQVLLKGPTITEFLKEQETIITGGRRRVTESEWEKILKEQMNTMDDYIKKAKEMAAIEYAPPFDYEQWITGYDAIGKKGKETFDDLKNAVTGWGSTFSAQLNDMLWKADTTFRDILRSFAQMITQMIIQKQVVEPMLAWMFTSAQGNVFDKGRVVPYDRGGIVDKPTVFPMAGGMGLMGEKGPEAVMPLARTPGGDLGVKTTGGGADIVDKSVNIIMQNPVFQDQVTQRRVFANIAAQITERVAPGAVVRSYDNDGPIRSRIRSRP